MNLLGDYEQFILKHFLHCPNSITDDLFELT